MSISNDNRKEKEGINIRMVSDIARALLILTVAVMLLFNNWFKIQQISEVDELLRYIFGGTSLFYGSFRLYRGIKREELL